SGRPTMSAHFAPLNFLCRMAVYAAALLVLATARLPELPVAEVAVAPTRPSLVEGRPAEQRLQRRRDEPGPPSLVRSALAAMLLVGVAAEARRRRPSWR